VDYEAISMLNVSATQELAKQLKAQASELAAVKAERDGLAREVAELRAATARQDKRLASIEAQIEAMARPVAQPVSLQAKVGAE
jgi:septal ring factor EnvC (AmiA/AmiB activator)